MNAVILKLKKRVKKLQLEIEGCRGYGNCSSDYDQMRRCGDEIKGLKYAIRLLQRSR